VDRSTGRGNGAGNRFQHIRVVIDKKNHRFCWLKILRAIYFTGLFAALSHARYSTTGPEPLVALSRATYYTTREPRTWLLPAKYLQNPSKNTNPVIARALLLVFSQSVEALLRRRVPLASARWRWCRGWPVSRCRPPSVLHSWGARLLSASVACERLHMLQVAVAGRLVPGWVAFWSPWYPASRLSPFFSPMSPQRREPIVGHPYQFL